MSDALKAALLERAKRERASRQGGTLDSRKVIATTDDGGVVYEGADGNRSYSSPGYSTSDPARIEEIMKGATPASMMQEALDQERIAENPVAARALKAVEGVPFVGSYADEAVGLASEGAASNMRATSQAMERENPGESTALGLTGAVAGSVPMALAAGPSLIANAGETLGVRALQGAMVAGAGGAAEGAIYGAGEQEGGRAENARQGAVFGGGAGAALGAAAPFVANAVKWGLGKLRGTDIAVIQRELGISPEAATVVKNAIDAGDMDGAYAALSRAGDSAMLADAGQPARELLDAAANAGGPAGRIVREAVEGRAAKAAGLMDEALDGTLGKPMGAITAKGAIRTASSAARDQAYKAAYSAPIDYASPRGQALERLLSRVPDSAIRKANSLMQLEGVESAQIIARIADDGAVTFERLPDVRQIDYLTRALNDVADAADGKGKLGGTTAVGRATADLSRNIRNMVKGAVPEYKEALSVASDAISESKAVDLGYDLFRAKTKPEIVARSLHGASRAEREAAKQGLRSYIQETVDNVSAVISDGNLEARQAVKVVRDMSSAANQKKLRMLLGKKQADALLDEIDRAATGLELRAAVAMNSKTAVRQSIQGSVRDQVQPGVLETLTSGEPINAGKRFVQLLTGNSAEAQALREAGIYEEIATALTQTKGRKAKSALRIIGNAIDGQSVSEQEAAFVGTVLATSGVLSASHTTAQALRTK